MSFGWSAGDIASTIAVLVKVGKALKNSDGAASEYQDTVEFIKSLVKTLESVQTIPERYPDLEWKDNLTEQAKAMDNAIEAFKKKIDKYDLSLGMESSRRKAKRIPREVQFALSADVKELRVAVTQPFLIMGFWVNQQALTSVLNLSRTATMSQHRLEAWTISARDAIPRITESLEILDSTVKSGAQVLNDSQQGAESRIRGDLGELKNRIGAIEDLQRSLEGSTRASKTELVRWQTELQHSLESLCDCVKTYLDVLLQQAEEKQQNREGNAQSESTNALLPFQLITSTVKFIGSSVASGLIAAHSATFFLRKEEPRDHSSVLVVPRLATSYEDAWEAAFRGVEKPDSRNDLQSSTTSSERIGVSTENTRTNQASISSPKQTGSEREPSGPPNVDGWWVCCYDDREVNPSTWGHACPDCAPILGARLARVLFLLLRMV